MSLRRELLTEVAILTGLYLAYASGLIAADTALALAAITAVATTALIFIGRFKQKAGTQG